jgi:lysophospholipase L1-like esterase
MKKVLITLITIALIISIFTFFNQNKISAAPSSMPIISKNVPVFSSSDVASYANDESYSTVWRGAIPGWIAFDLSDVSESERSKVLLAWYNNDTYDYDPTVLSTGSYNIPSDYTIEVNAAESSEEVPEDDWVTLETISDNSYHSRQHTLDLEGYNWIRMNISAVNSLSGDIASLNIDIHNIENGIEDSWIFYGDSITAGGMVVNGSGDGTFAEIVNSLNSNYFPAAENGGVGSILSTHGVSNIERWLSSFPGKYVGISYGTNDSWGNQTGSDNYYNNTEAIVQAVLAANKIPLVPKIPWSTLSDINANIPTYNEKIDALYETYPEIIPGPDFESLFKENTDYLSSDGVHPNDTGYSAMRTAWAQIAIDSVYSDDEPTNTTNPTDTATVTDTESPTDTPEPSVTISPTETSTDIGKEYEISYIRINDWGSGSTINITITNNSASPISDWTLEFEYSGDQKISNMWSGSFEQTDSSVFIQPAAWTNSIESNTSITLGFNISYSNTNEDPTDFVFTY